MQEDIITLRDEDGEIIEFEKCLELEAEGNKYVVLTPLGSQDGETYICRVENDGDEDIFVLLDEDDEESEMIMDVCEVLSDDGLYNE